jgi:hypothetical protein
MRKTQEKLSSTKLFNYLKMFNRVVVIDEDLAAQLPATEFELSFNPRGDIYVNGVSLGANIVQRYNTIAVRMKHQK